MDCKACDICGKMIAIDEPDNIIEGEFILTIGDCSFQCVPVQDPFDICGQCLKSLPISIKP